MLKAKCRQVMAITNIDTVADTRRTCTASSVPSSFVLISSITKSAKTEIHEQLLFDGLVATLSQCVRISWKCLSTESLKTSGCIADENIKYKPCYCYCTEYNNFLNAALHKKDTGKGNKTNPVISSNIV